MGKARMVADLYKDTVCFNQGQHCVKEFPFLSVAEADKLAALDGFVGLAPDDPSNGESFVGYLKNAGLIDKKMVAINLKKRPEKSTAQFGGWLQSEKRNQTNDFYTYKIKNDKAWEVEVWDVAMDGKSFDDKIHSRALFDSFDRVIELPNPEFTNFKDFMVTKHTADGLICAEVDGIMFCYFEGLCETKNQKFTDLVIQLEDTHGFRVPPTSYLLNKVNKDNKPYCSIGIQQSRDGDFHLGEVFMQNFYITFDYENKQIGINGNYIVEGLPLKKFPLWAIILIAVSVLAVILAIAIFCYVRSRNQKLKDQLGEYNQLDSKK